MTHTKHTEAREAAANAVQATLPNWWGRGQAQEDMEVQDCRRLSDAAIDAYLCALSADADGRVKEIRDRHERLRYKLEKAQPVNFSTEGRAEFRRLEIALDLITSLQAENARLRELLQHVTRDDVLHYLRSIYREIRELDKRIGGLSLQSEVSADNCDWLGCHIDWLERTVRGFFAASEAKP